MMRDVVINRQVALTVSRPSAETIVAGYGTQSLVVLGAVGDGPLGGYVFQLQLADQNSASPAGDGVLGGKWQLADKVAASPVGDGPLAVSSQLADMSAVSLGATWWGHMQPLSSRELRKVPEGQNTMEWWNVWSLSQISVGDQVTDGLAPVVSILKVEYWKESMVWHGQGVLVNDALTLPAPS